ncbi:MAG: DUF692 family protein [Clostridia bacterium]
MKITMKINVEKDIKNKKNKIKIGVNYLTETINLIKEEKIDIEYIKYPSISYCNIEDIDNIRRDVDTDILLHGISSNDGSILNILSDNFIDRIDIEQTFRMLYITRTPGISIHIGGNESCNLTKEEMILRAKENIYFLKTKFSGLEFYSLENKNEINNLLHIDPSVISDIINECNCDFLFDVTHAIGASKKLNMSVYEYIDKLPLDKIYEIHLNGYKYIGDLFMSHIKTNEECYDILKYVISKSNVKIITIEYGTKHVIDGEPHEVVGMDNFKMREEIIEQIDRVKKICGV